MARGRHRRRSGLLSRLLPRRRRPDPQPLVRVEISRLEAEVVRLRWLSETTAQTSAATLVRAARAEELAVAATERAALAEGRLSVAYAELARLRTDLAALREELVWAFAEGKLPVDAPTAVVDLRDGVTHTA